MRFGRAVPRGMFKMHEGQEDLLDRARLQVAFERRVRPIRIALLTCAVVCTLTRWDGQPAGGTREGAADTACRSGEAEKPVPTAGVQRRFGQQPQEFFRDGNSSNACHRGADPHDMRRDTPLRRVRDIAARIR